MAQSTGDTPWCLEVVRGAGVGRRFPLAGGTVVLGNALDGAPGLDLSDLERESPRKMAGRQAQVDVANGSISLRDLNSPGGTFVDRRRLPPNSDLPLKEGDVIQLGGVQLRVTRGSAPTNPAPARPVSPPPRPTAPFLFTLRSGTTCRSWDDFLAVSTQQWPSLRDELTSGRLAAFLATIGRSDLAPDPAAPGSPDERLDLWIGRLPTSREARPEIDVHPRVLAIKAPSGGGVVRKTIRISNVGERLLKVRARVEPPGAWVALGADLAGRELAIIESAEVAIEATLPESMTAPMTAVIVFEGNGGGARVEVRAEPATAKSADSEGLEPVAPAPRMRLRERLAAIPATARWWGFPIAAVAGRLAISGANAALPDGGPSSPGLLGPLALMALVGALVGTRSAMRGGEARDLPSSLFAGGVIGAMLAALVVALCRSVEASVAARIGASWWMAAVVWAAIGAALAGLSLVIASPRAKGEAK